MALQRLWPLASFASSCIPVAAGHRNPRPSHPSQDRPTTVVPSPEMSYALLRLGQLNALGSQPRLCQPVACVQIAATSALTVGSVIVPAPTVPSSETATMSPPG